MDDINLDSESELEDSFYERETRRMQAELTSIRAHAADPDILSEVRRNLEKEEEMITEVEGEVAKLQ